MPDELGKLLAGQLSLVAVLANVLIDKGIVTREELCERFQQAHDAAMQSSAAPLGAQMLAELITVGARMPPACFFKEADVFCFR